MTDDNKYHYITSNNRLVCTHTVRASRFVMTISSASEPSPTAYEKGVPSTPVWFEWKNIEMVNSVMFGIPLPIFTWW